MHIVVLIVILLLLFSITTVYYSLHYGISPMPSNWKAKKVLFAELPERVEGVILELGAGFGTLAIPLARRYLNPVVAYEISPFPYLILRMLKFFLKLNNLKVVRRDFLKSSFHDAGLCVCYLYPAGMQKLEKKFKTELPAGAYVVSNTFALKGWSACKEARTLDLYDSKIFFYRMPS